MGDAVGPTLDVTVTLTKTVEVVALREAAEAVLDGAKRDTFGCWKVSHEAMERLHLAVTAL